MQSSNIDLSKQLSKFTMHNSLIWERASRVYRRFYDNTGHTSATKKITREKSNRPDMFFKIPFTVQKGQNECVGVSTSLFIMLYLFS